MDLFKKAGKAFEETKQSFLKGAKAEFECTSCGEPVTTESEFCPHCGEASVEPVD